MTSDNEIFRDLLYFWEKYAYFNIFYSWYKRTEEPWNNINQVSKNLRLSSELHLIAVQNALLSNLSNTCYTNEHSNQSINQSINQYIYNAP